MDSHYDILGLAQSASFDEVKKAYRRLAQKYHPDKNRNDPVRSAEMFTRVRRAYDILMSPDARRQHDDELAREAVFEAELKRRRNAYADARHAYSSNPKDWASRSAGPRASNEGSSAASPTDWHARAWDLVQRAPTADALARALRGEGCLPSLAAPLARDVALEYEQLRQARENFDSATGTKAHAGAGAYASAQADAKTHDDTASYNDASRSRSSSNAGRSSNGDTASAGARTSGQATGTQHKARGMPFGNPTRPTRNMPFGAPRRASTSSNARFAWLVVAAMVLILGWRYLPSSRTPSLRAWLGRSHVERSDDVEAFHSRRIFPRQDDGSERGAPRDEMGNDIRDETRNNARSETRNAVTAPIEPDTRITAPFVSAPIEPEQQGQIKRLLPGVLPRFDNDGPNQRVIGAVGAFDNHAGDAPNVPSPDTQAPASDRP